MTSENIRKLEIKEKIAEEFESLKGMAKYSWKWMDGWMNSR